METTSNNESAKNASIIRVIKNRNYTVMSNQHLQCKELSLKAKGLMSLCLSLPENWNYTISGLVSLSQDGPDGVKSALKSLKQFGFLKIEKIRNSKGVFESIYTFYENPEENPDFKPVSEDKDKEETKTVQKSFDTPVSSPNNLSGKSTQVNLTRVDLPHRLSHTGLTDVVKPMQINTNNKILKLNTNINTHVKSNDFTAAALLELYQSICIHFPQPTRLSCSRVKKSKLRLLKYPEKIFWQKVFENAEKSDFCRKSSFFSFDWCIKNDDNPLKVFEGNYNQQSYYSPPEIGENKYAKCYK